MAPSIAAATAVVVDAAAAVEDDDATDAKDDETDSKDDDTEGATDVDVVMTIEVDIVMDVESERDRDRERDVDIVIEVDVVISIEVDVVISIEVDVVISIEVDVVMDMDMDVDVATAMDVDDIWEKSTKPIATVVVPWTVWYSVATTVSCTMELVTTSTTVVVAKFSEKANMQTAWACWSCSRRLKVPSSWAEQLSGMRAPAAAGASRSVSSRARLCRSRWPSGMVRAVATPPRSIIPYASPRRAAVEEVEVNMVKIGPFFFLGPLLISSLQPRCSEQWNQEVVMEYVVGMKEGNDRLEELRIGLDVWEFSWFSLAVYYISTLSRLRLLPGPE